MSASSSITGGVSCSVGSSGRETDTLIWTIVGRDPRDGCHSAAPPAFGASLNWDAASLLHALDRIPDSQGASGGAVLGHRASAAPGTAETSGRAAGPSRLGGAGLGAPPSPGSSPPVTHAHAPEALVRLLSSIAPSSPVTAPSTGPHPGASPGNPPVRIGAAPLPAPASPSGSPHLQSAAAAALLGLAAAGPVLEAGSPELPSGNLRSQPNTGRHQQQQLSQGLQQPQTFTRSGAGPGVLLGPHIASRGPAAAPLVCAAAGVPLPSWAASLLPPPPPPAAGLRLDPSLEWALGLLSHWVTPLEPRARELSLANRILASHLGPQPRPVAPKGAADTPVAVAAATGTGAPGGGGAAASPGGGGGVAGGRGAQPTEPTLPWPLVLPVLDAVAERLSPPSALALLRVISLQVGPDWRRDLPPRQQAHLAATLQACFRAALRSPDAVSPSAAAGLLGVMSRLRLRSAPACSLLVGRILAGVVPERRASGRARTVLAAAPAAAAAAAAEAVAGVGTEEGGPASSGNGNGSHGGELPTRGSSESGGPASRSVSPIGRPTSIGASRTDNGIISTSNGSSMRGASGRGDGSADGKGRRRVSTARKRPAVARRSGRMPLVGKSRGASGGGGLLLLRRRRAAQLRWVCVALSALARLRVPHSALPRRAVTKLLWAALFSSAHWTPAIAAALPVWANRLACRPPAAFLRRYGRTLLTTTSAAPDPGPGPASDSSRCPLQQQHQEGPLAASKGGQERAAVTTAVAAPSGGGRIRGACGRLRLADRMTASQLVDVMEALAAQYGPCTTKRPSTVSAAAAAAAASRREASRVGGDPTVRHGRDSGGGGSSGGISCIESGNGVSVLGGRRLALQFARYRALMLALADALSRRVRQLQRQQLCRLPLLLRQVWHSTKSEAEAREGQWQQVYLVRTRLLLPSCDVVDVMLLLRGLAGPAQAAEGRVAVGVMITGPGADATSAAASYSTSPCCVFWWLGSELADDALRRYLALLPSASLRHTAAVLESLSLLWGGQQQPASQSSLRGQPPPLASAPSPSTPGAKPMSGTISATATGLALSAPSSPNSAAAPATPASAPSPEADLRRRRLADLASERDFLLQQLDEHVAMCLSYSGADGGDRHSYGRAVHYSRDGGGRPGRDRCTANGSGSVAASPGLLVKILTAYSRLQRPPAPRLQGALEAALVGGAGALGSSGWQAVRAAYQRLRLQPGRELSVALLTFA